MVIRNCSNNRFGGWSDVTFFLLVSKLIVNNFFFKIQET